MRRMNLCTQHHTVLSLERSLSISAVGCLHSSGSVLADSCVTGCTVCAHTFVRIMFYAQRQALIRPLLQHVSACYTHTIVVLDTAWPWASEVKPTGFAVCARTFARINLYAQDHTALSFYRSLLGFKHAAKSYPPMVPSSIVDPKSLSVLDLFNFSSGSAFKFLCLFACRFQKANKFATDRFGVV